MSRPGPDVLQSITENRYELSGSWMWASEDIYSADYREILQQPVSLEATNIDLCRFRASTADLVVRSGPNSTDPVIFACTAYMLEDGQDAGGDILYHSDLLGLFGDGPDYIHLSDTQFSGLTGAGDTALHFHSSDRSRSNHTGTQLASTISDFGAAAILATAGTYQPLSAELSALAGLSSTGYAKRTGAGAWSVVTSIPQSDVAGLTTALAGKQNAITTGTTAQYLRGDLSLATFPTTWAWGSITGKPTTLAGYGITDAQPLVVAGSTAQYWRGDKTWQTLNAAAVGLGNVLNVAQEPALGSSTAGYLLSSNGTTRSWVAPYSHPATHPQSVVDSASGWITTALAGKQAAGTYMAIDGSNAATSVTLASAVESNVVQTVQYGQGAITTNSPVTNASLRAAIKFNWYTTNWAIGNIRGGSTDTMGFGITTGNGTNLRWRVTNGTTYDYNNLEVTGTIKEGGVLLSSKYALDGHVHDAYLSRFGGAIHGVNEYGFTAPTLAIGDGQYGISAYGGWTNIYSAGGNVRLYSRSGASNAVLVGVVATQEHISAYYQTLITGLTQTAWNTVSANMHSHPNMGELNAIGTGDIAKWNDVTSKVYNARIGNDTYMGDDASTMRARMLAYGNHFGRANYAGTPTWYNFVMLRETTGTNYGSIGYSADGNWYSTITNSGLDTTVYKKIWDSGNFNPGNYQPLENQRLSNGNDVTFNTVRVAANNTLGLFIGDAAAIGDCNFQNGMRIQGLGNGATGYWIYGNAHNYMGWNGSAFVANGANLILEGDARLTNARTPTAHDHDFSNISGRTKNVANVSNRIDSGWYNTEGISIANGWPENSASWWHLLSSTHDNQANYYAMQIAASFYAQDFRIRSTMGNGLQAWSKIWTSSDFTTGSFQEKENQRLSTGNFVTFRDLTVKGGMRSDSVVSGDGPGQGAHCAIYDEPNSKGWLLQHNQSNDRLSFMHLDSPGAWNSKIYFTQNGDVAANGMVVAGNWASGIHAVGGGWAWGGHSTLNSNVWSGFMNNANGETLIGSTNSMPLRLAVNQTDVASFSGASMNVHCAKLVMAMTNAWNTGSATTYPTIYGINSPGDGNPYVMIPALHIPYSAASNFTCNSIFNEAGNGGSRIRFANDKNASSFGDFGILPSHASAFTSTLPIYVNSDKVLTAIDSANFVQGTSSRRSTNSTGGTLWSAKPAGFYSQTGDSINGATGGASWTHLINCRGSDWDDASQYTFQIASSFSSDYPNTGWGAETYAMRTITAGTPNSWKVLWHSGNLTGDRTEHFHAADRAWGNLTSNPFAGYTPGSFPSLSGSNAWTGSNSFREFQAGLNNSAVVLSNKSTQSYSQWLSTRFGSDTSYRFMMESDGSFNYGNGNGVSLGSIDINPTNSSLDANILFDFKSGITVSYGAITANTYAFFNNAVSFWGQSGYPQAKPTVTGSKGGNAALASLLTALASYGLVTDSTT